MFITSLDPRKAKRRQHGYATWHSRRPHVALNVRRAVDTVCVHCAEGDADMLHWPVKTHELLNPHMDSRVWNRFAFRRDDIVIASWGKSGCTWLQQIVGQLVLPESESSRVAAVSPWMELALQDPQDTLHLLETQRHRRIIKTHLPVDALVYSPDVKYVFIGRDGRDVAWSLFNHFRRLNPQWYARMQARACHGRIPTERPDDFRAFFRQWLREDGYPFWPFWDNVRSWWEIRELPNLLLLHFEELRADLETAVNRIAGFLGVHVPRERMPLIAGRCTFDYMKRNAAAVVDLGQLIFEGGAQAFFHKGERGGWQSLLEQSDVAEYETARVRALPADCARWLTNRGIDS